MRTWVALAFVVIGAGSAAAQLPTPQSQDHYLPRKLGGLAPVSAAAPADNPPAREAVPLTEAPAAATTNALDAAGHGDDGFFATTTYLLLKPRRRDMDFVIVDPVNDGRSQGRIESLDWETNSGFRIGAGYRFPGEGWETGVYYTNFHSTDSRAVNSPAGGTLLATMTAPSGPVSQVGAAIGNAGLNFEVLDLEVGRNFAVSDALTLRLAAGPRVAWITQHFDVFYDGGDANRALASSPINCTAGGLRAGGEGQWLLGKHFCFYANAFASLLVGDFRTHLTETNNGGSTLVTDVTEKFDKMVPVTELGIGFAWQGEYLRARLGYEFANWFGMVDSPDFADDVHIGKLNRRTGDLGLDGLAFQVEVGY